MNLLQMKMNCLQKQLRNAVSLNRHRRCLAVIDRSNAIDGSSFKLVIALIVLVVA